MEESVIKLCEKGKRSRRCFAKDMRRSRCGQEDSFHGLEKRSVTGHDAIDREH
jgi:hypothetical protein